MKERDFRDVAGVEPSYGILDRATDTLYLRFKGHDLHVPTTKPIREALRDLPEDATDEQFSAACEAVFDMHLAQQIAFLESK